MNKKTLIFLLSAMLFLTTSFIVYSWTEPTTPMPSGYTAPLNTSATAQNKVGELGAASFVNGAHTWNECEAAGGTVVDSDVELKQCRFELSACPSEWNQYKNFSEAPSGDCTLCYYGSCYTCVTYSLKPWGNSIFSCRLPNSTTYWTADTPCCFPTNGADMCTMARTAIGCY